MRRVCIFWLLVLALTPYGASRLFAESVEVKYRGLVDLRHFECNDISRSSFIKRVCYDPPNEYMVINLNGIYYHYCQIDDATVHELLSADSMGRFYNTQVKGRFDCRVYRVPNYQ
jgi:hypothetical protein